MQKKSLIFSFFLCFISLESIADDVLISSKQFPLPRIGTCYSISLSEDTKKWRYALGEVLFNLENEFPINKGMRDGGIEFRSCPSQPIPGCSANTKLIYCSEEFLIRYIIAAAWISAWIDLNTNIISKDISEIFTARDALELAESEIYGDKQLKEQVFHRLSLRNITTKKIRNLENKYNDIKNIIGNGQISKSTKQIYQVFRILSSSIFASIWGHEFLHHYAVCPIDKKSSAEENGTVSLYRKHTLSGKLFCAQPLTNEEYQADKCSLRFVEAVIKRNRNEYKVSKIMDYVVRQYTIDVITWLLSFDNSKKLSDIIEYTDKGKDDFNINFKNQPGYILKPLRILLVIEALNSTRNDFEFVGPKGETADILKLSLDWSLFDCRRPISKIQQKKVYKNISMPIKNVFSKPYQDTFN